MTGVSEDRSSKSRAPFPSYIISSYKTVYGRGVLTTLRKSPTLSTIDDSQYLSSMPAKSSASHFLLAFLFNFCDIGSLKIVNLGSNPRLAANVLHRPSRPSVASLVWLSGDNLMLDVLEQVVDLRSIKEVASMVSSGPNLELLKVYQTLGAHVETLHPELARDIGERFELSNIVSPLTLCDS